VQNGGIYTHNLKNILLVTLLKLVEMMIYMIFDVAFHIFSSKLYFAVLFLFFLSNLISSKLMKGNLWPSNGKG